MKGAFVADVLAWDVFFQDAEELVRPFPNLYWAVQLQQNNSSATYHALENAVTYPGQRPPHPQDLGASLVSSSSWLD